SHYADSKGIKVLYATEAGKVSYENDELKQGVFTSFLLKALSGQAAGQDGLILFQDVAEYVRDGVKQFSFANGQPQTPYEAGESSGDFLVARAKGIEVQSGGGSGGPVGGFAAAPKELRDRYARLKADGVTMQEKVDERRKEVASQNVGLRSDISAAANRIKAQMELALSEINSGQ